MTPSVESQEGENELANGGQKHASEERQLDLFSPESARSLMTLSHAHEDAVKELD